MSTYPMLDYLWIIPLLPLLGAATNGLLGREWPNKIVNTVALGATVLAYTASPRPTPSSRADQGYHVPGTGDPASGQQPRVS